MKKAVWKVTVATLLFFFLNPSALVSANERAISPSFPSSPPTGVEGYNVYDSTIQDARAKLYLWKQIWQGEEVIFAHFVPLSDYFHVHSSTFVVEQSSNLFTTAFYDNEGMVVNLRGYSPDQYVSSPLTLRLEVLDYNNFDPNQSFELCNFDSGGNLENCVVYNLRQIFTLSYEYSLRAGTPVTFNVRAGTEQKYYQFWVCGGYGTSSYGQGWQTIQALSTLNTCDYTFNTPGHYVVVCWIKEVPSAAEYEIVGFSIEVTQ